MEDLINTIQVKIGALGNSLAVKWLRFCASFAGRMGSISVQGTKILQAV